MLFFFKELDTSRDFKKQFILRRMQTHCPFATPKAPLLFGSSGKVIDKSETKATVLPNERDVIYVVRIGFRVIGDTFFFLILVRIHHAETTLGNG